MRKVEIALPKSERLLTEAYQIFLNVGYESSGLEREIKSNERKQLEFESDCGRVVFMLVRPSEIPQYVDKNWADFGIARSDAYREYELSSVSTKSSMRGDNFLTDVMPDFKLCKNSRLCVAGIPNKHDFYNKCKSNSEKVLTVATSFPYISANYFKTKGILVDIITVTGSVELMPKHADADVIFDIVESGRALKENGLEIFEEAMPIQTRLLVSKAALKYDPNISKLLEELKNETK